MSGEHDRSFEGLLPYALEILDGADAARITISVMGGIAIRMRSPELGGLDPASRPYHDIDLVARLRQVRAADRLLQGLRYMPDRAVNAQFGTFRRLYRHPDGFHVDLFFERLEFCHTIDLNGRIGVTARTLAPADLVLQKLQIVERNEKDFFDLYLLLLNHDFRRSDPEQIDHERIATVVADDWGFSMTALDFIDDARAYLPAQPLSEEARGTVAGRLAALETLIRDAPKSARWRARARLGRRVRWYRNVEELL